MFGLFSKKKNVNELEQILAEIESNMQNNYKDVAQAAFREFEQKLSELIEQGKTQEEIARAFGCSVDTIQRREKEYGLGKYKKNKVNF